MKEQIIVEYSVKQKAFHKTTLVDLISRNFENIYRKKETDYLPIFAQDSHEEADKGIEEIRKYFNENGI